MENVATETGSSTTERRSRWLFALVTTSLVTVAGLVIAVQQFVLKCLWDQSAHTRTIGGVLYMLLGVVGICLPLLLFRHKRRLLSARPSRQWLLVGIPLAYMMAFALCMEASLRSTTLVLPRPFTPTAVVRYDASGSGVRIRGGWNPNLQSSSTDAKLHGGVDEFSAHLYQGFHRHPRHETITIVGRAKLLDGGAVQISLDVDAEEAIRFAVEDLADVKITRDGQPIGASDSQSGKFPVTITGRRKKDT